MTGFKTIVAAIDIDDELGSAVLKIAADVANRYGAQLHVVDAWPKIVGIGFPYARHAEIAEIEKHEAERQARLAELEARVQRVSVNAIVMAPVGDKTDTLETYLENEQADLLVIGSHQKGPLKKLFSGSVSAELIKDAKCAVLVVTKNFADTFVQP
jgi:nucleotide-binding universal stress UspA family protein